MSQEPDFFGSENMKPCRTSHKLGYAGDRYRWSRQLTPFVTRWTEVFLRIPSHVPGDLLTTADTPGHAMKAPRGEKARGAILGKAMSSLAKGERGHVLILVTLQ